ncbi:MAG: MFS transporter, partial [Pleurocapsa sp.]
MVFITGMFVGWGIRFLIPTVNQTLTLLDPGSSKIAMTIFFIVLGLSAIPIGKIGTKLGNSMAMMLGCSISTASVTFLALMPSSSLEYIAIAFLILGYSLVLNGAIHYANYVASTNQSGFGIGMYFGGLNLGVSLFGFIF